MTHCGPRRQRNSALQGGPDSYEAPACQGGTLGSRRTRQCGVEDTATPSPSWRRWSSPKAACGAPKAQGLRNVANPVIIRAGVFCVERLVDLPRFQRDSAKVKAKRESKVEPCAEYGWRRNQLISGRVLPAPRSLLRYCEGKGLQGGWDQS